MQPASVFRPSFSPFNQQITVSATLHRKQNPNRRHHHHHHQQQSPPKSNLHQQMTAKVEGPSPLRGSDVLIALQRADTLKKKKKKQQQRKLKTARGKEGGESESEEFDYDNVRPIIVRSDWKERIDELETRVQELKSQYHY
ncbi:uncharacterized protein A4U43_C01F12620 [Asparagus officinalis]|uniref:Uncharacterized protein n=1 Tax=Asparagus officinalis TaxID=4686 RepID=A0A5P1FPP2_ASPOF|nr:uncharacterized protein LOC109822117 [Asparagus officinalis]ONK79994.1 uncharacterized protein A4U43_C01F12620 [Asparagus officinalis]